MSDRQQHITPDEPWARGQYITKADYPELSRILDETPKSDQPFKLPSAKRAHGEQSDGSTS